MRYILFYGFTLMIMFFMGVNLSQSFQKMIDQRIEIIESNY